MKERLIKALKEAKDEIIDLDLDGLADKLIEAGCVIPKFKAGDKVFSLGSAWVIEEVAPVIRYGMVNSPTHYFMESELFATEEEARAALRREYD